MPGARYAIAYTPPPESPLTRFGAGILGYDCFEGTEVPRLAVQGVDPAILSLLTVEPRRYGFNASFVAPFPLNGGSESHLRVAVESFAKSHRALLIGPLALASVDGFIALRSKQHVRLREYAAACRSVFDPFRREIDPVDRQIANLGSSSNSLGMLRLYMPLAGPVPEHTPGDLQKHLARAFGRLAGDHVEVGSVSLMRQDDPGARFRVLMCTRLTGR